MLERATKSLGLALLTVTACGPQEAEPGRSSSSAGAALDASLDGRSAALRERIELQRDAVRRNPTDPAAWGELGLACEANGLVEAGRDAYARALELAPGAGRWRYRLALQLEQLGDLEGARRELSAAAVSLPAAHTRLGWLELELGDVQGAKASLREALRQLPGDPAARAGMARVFLLRERPERAIEVLEALLAERPDDPYVLNLTAIAYRQAGRWDEVERRLGAVEAAEPRWPDPDASDLARLRVRTPILLQERAVGLVDENPERSLAILTALVEDDPDDVGLRNTLANAYARAGRLEDARRTFEGALELEPEGREALVNLAIVLLRLGQPDAARERAERALERHPSYGPAHEARGDALRAVGELEAAAAAYRRALELDQRRSEPFVKLGLLELDREQWEPARDALEHARRNGASGPAVAIGLALAWAELGNLDRARGELDGLRVGSALAPFLERVRVRIDELVSATGTGG